MWRGKQPENKSILIAIRSIELDVRWHWFLISPLKCNSRHYVVFHHTSPPLQLNSKSEKEIFLNKVCRLLEFPSHCVQCSENTFLA
jgi:hypothetical protein